MLHSSTFLSPVGIPEILYLVWVERSSTWKELLLALFVPINNQISCCSIKNQNWHCKKPENIKSWTVFRADRYFQTLDDPEGEAYFGFHDVSKKYLSGKPATNWPKVFYSNSNLYLLKYFGPLEQHYKEVSLHHYKLKDSFCIIL